MMHAPPTRARQRGFFDFSISEIAIIFGVALVVLGPKKLPPLVAQIGRWVGRARHMARQFREQLEQEVNSINEVKPVRRNVPPVGPATPAPEVAAAASAAAPVSTEHVPVAEEPAQEPQAAPPPPVPGQEPHPEAQIYFALNGTEPAVVAENPHAPPPATAASQEPGEAQAAAVADAPATPHAPAEPASVEVIFPHDHG